MGFEEFKDMFEASTPPIGSALHATWRSEVNVHRSTIMEDRTASGSTTPMLVVTGDEDWPCLLPGVFMKQCIKSAGLVVVPNTGHTVNLEEPALFNQAVADFIAQVEAGRWPVRDPRAVSASITGMTKDD